MKTITCQICGEQVHTIKSHLKKAHGPGSEKPMTLEEYRENFPDAPELSDHAKKALLEMQAKKKAQQPEEQQVESKPVLSDDGESTLVPMGELFDLNGVLGTMMGNGDPIMIPRKNESSHPELVPEIDENHVFDLDILKTSLMGLAANIPTYLYGHSGVGKSSIWKQICARTNRPLLRLQHTVNTEESHIVGQWVVKKHKDEDTGQVVSETVFELGPLPLAMKHGWVFLADEFDRSYSSVLSVYQAVLEGEPLFIKEADPENRIIKPHPDFRFVATGNTNGAGDETGLYNATVVQDAATFERFGIVQHVSYMEEAKEIEIVSQQAELENEDAKEIIDFCKKVRDKFPSEISLTIGPRVAINIGKIGLMKGNMATGVEICFANRLPDSEKEAVMQVAKRIWS